MKKIIIKESQLTKLINETINSEIYFNTFSEAVQKARSYAESKGYEIDDGDWFREINAGPGKPKEGQTTRASVGLIKNGKTQRKALHIQVYNRGDKFNFNYELNYYIS